MPRPPLLESQDSGAFQLLEDVMQKGAMQDEMLQTLTNEQARLVSLVQQQHEVVLQKLDQLQFANSVQAELLPESVLLPCQNIDQVDFQNITSGQAAGANGAADGNSSPKAAEDRNSVPGVSEARRLSQKAKLERQKTSQSAAHSSLLSHIYKKDGCLAGEYTKNRFTALVEHKVFTNFITFLIMFNSIFVGVEMQVGMGRALDGTASLRDTTIKVIEHGNHAMAFIFACELTLRIIAFRAHFFLGQEWQWNMFDALIVLTSIIDYLLAELISGLTALRALRALRLAKTLRIIRVVTVFRNLQLILSSLMNSLLSLVWMLFLLTLALYLVTIVFMGAAAEYIKEGPLANEPHSSALDADDMTFDQMRNSFDKDFRSLPRSMLTMFFTVTGGVDWYEVLRPLMKISWLYVVIFVAYQVFIVFGVFNVLNAVFVESVLTNRDKDLLIQNEQAKTRVFMRDLADLFYEGDTNGDNNFSLQELEAHCSNPRFCSYLNTHSLDATDAKTLFELLDQDGSGQVDVEEFVLGALKLKGPARCLDMVKNQTNQKNFYKQLDSLQTSMDSQRRVLTEYLDSQKRYAGRRTLPQSGQVEALGDENKLESN